MKNYKDKKLNLMTEVYQKMIEANVSTDVVPGNEYMVDDAKEKEAADSFSWVPVQPQPITVIDAKIENMEEYSGYIEIKFSNGDILTYNTIDVTGPTGPDYKTKIKVNDTQIGDEDTYAKFAGSGTWIGDMLNIYIDWKQGNKNEKL